MEKMTITERINALDFATLTQDDFDFLVERALKSVRKASGERKPTKTQIANAGLKDDIVRMLNGTQMTASEVAAALGISVQKASALLKQVVDSGTATRVKEGKVTKFTLVD